MGMAARGCTVCACHYGGAVKSIDSVKKRGRGSLEKSRLLK
jgi:hypothetical protein